MSRDSSIINVRILFAPLPEDRDVDSSAAKEFAVRMADAFRGDDRRGDDDDVEVGHLADWDKDAAFADATTTTSSSSVAVFLVVSCGPDGSVHRSVRKTTKWLKERSSSSSSSTTTTTTAAIALLGGAVCKTSAEQMEDQVYASGRKLANSLRKTIADDEDEKSEAPAFRLETQIELEAPEEKFDGWVRSWAERLLSFRRTG
mmetsp:Transcript_6013/g.14909  ORF Transcript_6013/g.14909 Transcript_6013/m.14909 type:complete len:202 (-) Transcript_6013:122-727(-)